MTENREIREGICGVCHGGCSVAVEFEDGKISKVHASKKFKPAAVCVRGSKSAGVVYAEDRLKTPLIRDGKKGSWSFREATWEEALDHVAEGFKKIKEKYGPQALASHAGRGTFEQSCDDFLKVATQDGKHPGFFEPLGSPNNGSVGSLCYNAFGTFAPMTTYGLRGSAIAPDLENAPFIVIWGTNPIAGSPPFAYHRVKRAKERGAEILVIDHYRSPIAKISDDYIGIKSGTDGALILSLMNVIIEENLYDEKFVEEYTHGFSEFKEYVRNYTPEKASEITGVPAERIINLARKLISTENAALLTYTGLEYSNCGVQTIRAIYLLWALSNNLDVPGGLLLNTNKNPRMKEFPKNDIDVEPFGTKEFPLFTLLTNSPQFLKLPQAVLEEKPYKIAGLLNTGACMTVNYPNSKLFEETLKNLEFFVTIDRFPTQDMLYADVVLPATTYYEDQSYVAYPTHARIRERMVDPIGEARPNIFILHEIAERLGYGELYPKNEEELLEMAFSAMPEYLEELKKNPDGVPFKAPPAREYKKYEKGLLRDDRKPGFPTPSGKIEFKSILLEEYGYDGLPVYCHAEEGSINTPELEKEFPLVFNSGSRIQTTFRTQHLNIPELTKLQPLPYVWLNPKDAEERNISTDDKVRLKTTRGEIFMYAKVSDDILPGDTEINVGGGNFNQKEEWSIANVNYLTSDTNVDPISGFPVYKALLCEVEKA